MLHIVRWDATVNKAETVPADELPATEGDVGDRVYWIDLDDPSEEEEGRVFGRFCPVHPLTLEDVTRPRRDGSGGAHLPKVEEFPDYLFVIVNPLPMELVREPTEPEVNHAPLPPAPLSPRRRQRPQLSAVLTDRVLITHHYVPLPCVREGQAYLARHGESLARGPDYVFHLLLDALVDEYAPVIERIADRLDKLETRLFTSPPSDVLTRLLRVKRQVSYLRKTLVFEREVLARLVRGEFRLVDTREIAYYRNVFDHQVRYTDLIESAREMVSDLMQTHLSATSNRLNEVMKVLTMISTVVLPMTLIAGVYGMNFEQMPELKWPLGYMFALGLMLITGVVAFAVFRWKKWL